MGRNGVGEGKGERKRGRWGGGELLWREGGGCEDGLGARMWGIGVEWSASQEGRGCGWWFKYQGEREVVGVEETLINSKLP